MKIPKTIKLLGYDFKVIVKKNLEGGKFSWSKREIEIGDKFLEKEEALLHELFEAIMVKRLNRYYTNEGGAEFIFIFNHTQFCRLMNDFYLVLKENNLLNGNEKRSLQKL